MGGGEDVKRGREGGRWASGAGWWGVGGGVKLAKEVAAAGSNGQAGKGEGRGPEGVEERVGLGDIGEIDERVRSHRAIDPIHDKFAVRE